MLAQSAIFAPMAAMAFLTFAVLGIMPVRRIAAARAGLVSPKDFRLGETDRVPYAAAIVNRNYMNLLELPTLFYPICLMFFVAGRVTATVMVLAWAYALFRVIHTAIHLTYNNVLHRLVAFVLSNSALGMLWILFFI